MIDEPAEPLLTTPEAAAVIGVHPVTLRLWRQRKRGPAYQNEKGERNTPAARGGTVLYRQSDLDAFKKEHATDGQGS